MKKFELKAEHFIIGLVFLFIVAFGQQFVKTAGIDLGRNEANRLFR